MHACIRRVLFVHYNETVYLVDNTIRHGVVANIIASHSESAIARGSIPRIGIFCHFFCLISHSTHEAALKSC
jgi:hypothetical protein